MVSEVRMANYQLSPPEVMICTGNVTTYWKVFKEAYKDYVIAIEISCKEDTIQATTLKTIMTDNGTQFWSKTYEDFAKKWEFDHLTTSPYDSQSNRKLEATSKNSQAQGLKRPYRHLLSSLSVVEHVCQLREF